MSLYLDSNQKQPNIHKSLGFNRNNMDTKDTKDTKNTKNKN